MQDVLTSSGRTNAAEFSVSEIANAVKRTVEDAFGYVRVRGEISGFRGQHASGHCYFTLKDADASIDAVVWKGNYARLAFKPEEGLEVIATGRLTTFPRSSKYQIVIEQIEPAGAGALMALLEERRRKLAAEGLFAKERKRALPYLPRVIGVVTSPTGAVIRDILHRLDDRFPSHVLLWPVRVQGDTCAGEVAAAIAGFNALAEGGAVPRPDLLIVARGGGSIEDLWGFNEEIVVRAVVASAIPIISAVGHETDTTLIDYAADMRAPTPTAAAEAAVPVRSELIGYVADLGGRQAAGARRLIGSGRDRLRAAAAGLPRPLDLMSVARQRLDHAASNLLTGLRQTSQAKHLALARIGARLAPAGQRQVERKRAGFAALAPKLSPAVLRADLRHDAARLAPLADRLVRGLARQIEARRAALAQADKLLASVSYKNVLARGFALVADAEGRLITGKADTHPGDLLRIAFANEDIVEATVGAGPAPRRKKPRAPLDSDDQDSLF